MEHFSKYLKSKHPKFDWILAAILLAAAFLYGWQIWKAGNANSFYTAAITSMTKSFKNFWFASFDPAGYITVDKPPVALWFMAISAKIFGVHGWSVVLPSALAGVGSVYLIYKLVQPYFGATAGRLAALAMTITPIVVADSRTDNMDSILIFFLLLSLILLEKGNIKKQSRWIIISFGLIGISFNIKMLQAFMILPAMYLFYWLAVRKHWLSKVKVLSISTIVLIIATLFWPLSVDMTSASKRPYEGGSEHNSVMELAFGYNGTQRLLGQSTGTGGAFPGMGNQKHQKSGNMKRGGMLNGQHRMNGNRSMKGAKGMTPLNHKRGMQGHAGNRGAGGGAFNIGSAGIFRLFKTQLGPQISWLLAFSIIGMIASWAFYSDKKKKWYHLSFKQKQLVLWLGWLVPVFGFFSVASFFHPYYMIMLAPPIAAFFGISVPILIKSVLKKTKNWQSYLLPIAIFITASLQAVYVYSYYPWLSWVIVISGSLIAINLIFFSIRNLVKMMKPLAGIGLVLIMAAPTWWSLTPTISAESSGIPTSGPDLLSSGGNQMGSESSVNTKMLNYLEKHAGNAKYLFATDDSSTASPYIIKTGKAVMAMGGFNGTDPAISLSKFKQLVKNGEVKYYYSGGKSGSANNTIVNWIKKHAKKVATSEYQSSSSSNQGNSPMQRPNSSSSMPSHQFNHRGKPNQKPSQKGGQHSQMKTMQQPSGGMGGSNGVLYDLSSIH
ncbi:putative mannosyltransferase YycA [Philodulcilactobacillus myokoensis]|uniref:Mannosyltransferase YycA n=1 Tax=Philodulcilactobacillus myokoensis TaxID=2929573 RepID=A0A9W6ESA9_9LACO|nr:glycosyltransferase family 39 protein [Philodulcilactobacillus myokoensis]GLB46163.1 putative mannosyltransferase YycA [Philodulcilactobacillus myokoensis]